MVNREEEPNESVLNSETLLNTELPLLPNLPPSVSMETTWRHLLPPWPAEGRPQTVEKDRTDRDTRAAQPAQGRILTVGYCWENTCKTCCSLGWETKRENSTTVTHHSSILTPTEPGTQQRQDREPEQRVPCHASLICIFGFPLEWELTFSASLELYGIAHVVHYCGRQLCKYLSQMNE